MKACDKLDRIIILYDCDCITLVRTNVPAEIIERSIAYKNDLLCRNIPISSDFEAMQEFIWDKDYSYIFDEIGNIEADLHCTKDFEYYEW